MDYEKELFRYFGLIIFVASITLFKELGKSNKLQKWYHLVWQWILISVGAMIWFTNNV